MVGVAMTFGALTGLEEDDDEVEELELESGMATDTLYGNRDRNEKR